MTDQEHGATFTPLDDHGHPTVPGLHVPLTAPVEAAWGREDTAKWLAATEEARRQVRRFGDSLTLVGATIANAFAPSFASIYDAVNATARVAPPPLSNKAARARAKAAKLRQRRAAKAAPRPWGTDWRDTASMLRMSIGSIVREGVPCHAVPCFPVVTSRMSGHPVEYMVIDDPMPGEHAEVKSVEVDAGGFMTLTYRKNEEEGHQ